MDDLVDDFRNLEVSALIKASKINPYVHDVTLGPSSIAKSETSPKQGKIGGITKPKITLKKYPLGTISPYKKWLNEFEKERQHDVQEAINDRHGKMLDFQKMQGNEQKALWYKRQQKLIKQRQQQEMLVLQANEEHDKSLSAQHEQQVQYYHELAERRKKNDEELRAKEKKKKELRAIIDNIRKDQNEFRAIYQDIINILKANPLQDSIKNLVTEFSQQLKTLPIAMEEVVTKCKMGKITESEAGRASELLQQLIATRNNIQKIIEDYNKEELAKQIKEAENKQIEASKINEVPKINDTIDTNTNKNTDELQQKIDKFVSKSSFRFYSDLQLFLQNHEGLYKQLAEDDTLKQFRFDCKKAVNIPVNAISAISPQHLLDKYSKLSNLLAGKIVQLGEQRICATKHPQGVAFCMDLLAKKFVLQGDLMISGNPEAAFYYASVILTLWNEFPDFGKLLLAHFHKQCPYIVPIYIPKAVGQSDEEYYKNLGYQYSDGVVENQDKFLKRMSGIIRLYLAIILGKPKKSSSAVHPHGLSYAWRWLASFLNLEPRADITATLIHVFLESAGYVMQDVYKKEFKKIIHFICVTYLPILKGIDSGGPVTRLEVLLQEYKQRGYFEEPNGLLPNNFW